MNINRLVAYLLNILIIFLVSDITLCKKKKNANYEEDSVSESRVSSRSRSSQTDQRDGVIDYDSAPDYPGRGRSGGGVGNNKKKKIPPGHQGRDPSSLPPGLAKKQQNNGNGGSGFNNRPIDGYDDIDQVERNPPRNVNRHPQPAQQPSRGNTNTNSEDNYSNNNNYETTNNKPNRGNSNHNSDYADYESSSSGYNSNSNSNSDSNNNRPQTQRPTQSKPNPFPEDDLIDGTSKDIPLSEWRSLERLKHHWENTAHTRSELSKKFIFWLEKDTDYMRHDACLTPSNELGHCHFVQHCPIPDVIRSFDKFLSFACFVRNRYVGICCPNDYLDPEDVQSQSQSQNRPQRVTANTANTATTRRPQQPYKNQQQQQQNPHRPSGQSDGSDYNNGICGVSENTRIIGGALADPKDWLWMAALILRSQSKPYCGGVLITNQHILTAAHCLVELTPEKVMVRLGAYDFTASADPEAQDFATEYFKIHPKYNRATNEADLAIIKLRTKTEFTEAIKPICLPQRNRDYAGQLAIVTGWGHTSFGGRGSPQLRQVSLPVWNNTQCDASYSIAISDNMLCAGNKQGGKDSCQGDSGGPLMLQGPNKRWMVIGVVSWGIKCGQPNYPGVYTRVSKYIDWIHQNSKDIYK